MYRRFSLAAFAALSMLTVFGTSPPVSAGGFVQDRYCLQGRQSGYPGNCQFSTYQQCLATASGTNEGCGINPMKAFAPQRHAYRRN